MRAATHRPVIPHSSGFTLLELLVAMFIAAIIFAMGYGAINQAVKSRVELQEQQAKLLELQTAVRVMEQDFVQLAPRPIRQPVGSDYYPALMSNNTSTSSSGNATQPVVALTRAGWTNPSGLQRPALQRVAYYFEKGTLRREYWTVLDPTQTSQPVKRDILTHLKSVSLRFYSQGQTWGPQWPLSQRPDDYPTRPVAVEITLETEDFGKILRVIELPG
jgi:general secretion pathway protein J